jgi:tetratricopeptide (TPR) repeat protein
MSVEVASNRFIVSSIAKSAAFYQQINANVSEFHKLGAWLSSHADKLQAFRQTDKLETIAEVLSNLPLQEYRLKGQYYLAWCRYRNGENTRSSFELVVEKSDAFREKGLISLAALEIAQKDYTTAIKHYEEAIRRAKSPGTLIAAARSIAVFKADHGDHKQALKELQALYPITLYAEPKTYYDYLNSLAVELAEAGEYEAATKASRIVLASPYAFAYPEWRETGQDLALRGYKSRSSVRVKTIPGNLLYLPEREACEPSDTSTQLEVSEPRPVSSLEKWKEAKMVKEPNGEEINPDKMSEQDMVMKLIQMLTTGEGDEKKIRELLKSAFKIFYGK